MSFAQAASVPFVISIVAGDAQTTGLNQVFPQWLIVRLTNGA